MTINHIKKIFVILLLAICSISFIKIAKADDNGCCEVISKVNPEKKTAYTATAGQCLGDDYYTATFYADKTVSGTTCLEKNKIPLVKPNINLPAIINPDLKVSIPNATKLTQASCEGDYCTIPWIADYIVGLQKYAIAIIGIVATIAMMIGGIIWLTSSGNQSQTSEARKWIGGGLTGLILVIASYMLLNIINPNLTTLKSLKIARIQKIDLSELILEGHEPMFDASNGKPITDTTYDDTFKSFAGCIGLDWRILKGIAFKESHLNPSVVNKAGFTGLFQTKDIYCEESVRLLGLSSSFCAAGVKDPAVNTAVASGMMKTNLGTINSLCGSSSDGVKIFMLYFGHSSGGGALKKAIKNYGCNTDSWPSDIFKGATKDYVKQTTETVLGQGVTSITNTSENKTCPKG